ncbi:MAG: histidine phosphatase family protein [Candidatus Korobacteraceae bacterium]
MSRARRSASSARCTLILVRHAHTDMAGLFCGHSDPPLSAQGLAQLSDLNRRLRGFSLSHIFSSDLQRARQTAESVAHRRNLQVHSLVSLRELAFGSWEGLDWEQVVARNSAFAQQWLDLNPSLAAPEGEEFEDFRKRIHAAMEQIATQVKNGCAVVVTHAGVIRTFLQDHDLVQAGQGPGDFAKFDYTSCWEVWREAGQWRLPHGDPCGITVSSDERRLISD